MKLSELNPKPEPAWRARLREFWHQADQRQQLDMQYYLKLGDRAAAQQLLESWDRPVLERRRKKKKAAPRSRFKYGQFGGWFYPGYNFSDSSDGGGDGGGGESLREDSQDIADIIQRFTASCVDYLGIENAPRIQLRRDPEWTRRNGTFGRYTAEPRRQIELATSGRHIVDILRTLAHEMTHALQDEQTEKLDHHLRTRPTPWLDASCVTGPNMNLKCSVVLNLKKICARNWAALPWRLPVLWAHLVVPPQEI